MGAAAFSATPRRLEGSWSESQGRQVQQATGGWRGDGSWARRGLPTDGSAM